MKKIILLTGLILIIGVGLVYKTLFLNIAEATSGACSYHGGVNCSAGSDSDGSVICNDGWRDGSVSYSSMVSCQQEFSLPPPPPPPTYTCSLSFVNGCKTEEDLKKIGACRSRSCPQEEWQITQCKQQIEENQKLQQEYNQCKIDYEKAVADHEKTIKELENSIKKYIDSINKSAENLENQLICRRIGMILGSDGKCGCPTGYEFNSNKTDCVEIKICPINSTKIGQNCLCNKGFVSKNGQCITHTEDCRLSFGDHIVGNKGDGKYASLCGCESGYEWNSTDTSCVIKKLTPQLNFDNIKTDIFPTIPKFLRILKINSQGENVITLQNFLIDKGHLKLTANFKIGYFGATTKQALIKFQKTYKLKTTGYLDIKTRNKINELIK